MTNSSEKLKKRELNRLFINGLGLNITWHSDENTVPLLLDLEPPAALKLRVYIFNCTNPPGGRSADEYKAQMILPGQKRGEQGSLDYSGGRMPILAAYMEKDYRRVFILWDADMHKTSSYSANLQVKSNVIIKAIYRDEVMEIERNNGEIVIVAQAKHLYKAILRRLEIKRDNILKGKYDIYKL